MFTTKLYKNSTALCRRDVNNFFRKVHKNIFGDLQELRSQNSYDDLIILQCATPEGNFIDTDEVIIQTTKIFKMNYTVIQVKPRILKDKTNLINKFNVQEGTLAYCHYMTNITSLQHFTYTIVRECELELLTSPTPKPLYYLQSGENSFNPLEYIKCKLRNHLQYDENSITLRLKDDWLLKLVEDVGFLILMVLDAYREQKPNCKQMILQAIGNFLRCRTGKSCCHNISHALIGFTDKLFATLDLQSETSTFEDNVTSCRYLLDKFDAIKDSQIFKKLYKLGLYALSFSIFEKLGISFSTFGYSIFEAENIKKKHHLGANFMATLLDSLLFLCERGFQILKTGNIQYLFHSGDNYVEYFETANKLKRQSLLLSNPEAHGFTDSSFRAELDDMIEKGDNMIQHGSKLSATDRRFLVELIESLKYIQCDICTKRAARENRKAPFSILLQGESNIGKSTITQILKNQFARIRGLDPAPTFCYTRNCAANFWDGFRTSQWALILDDVAAVNPNKAPNGDPSLMELIQIINNVPFVPDQASLHDKGRTPMKCAFVIATSNVKNLNAFHHFSHPSAVQRRLPFIITPTVKKEYSTEEGSLDSTKCSHNSDTYPDYWNFIVEKVIPRKTSSNDKIAGYEKLLVTDNIIELIQWYTKAVIQFETNQNLVEESVNALCDIPTCNLCFMPTKHCTCKLQSGEDIVSDIGYIGNLTIILVTFLLKSWFYKSLEYLFGSRLWFKCIKYYFSCKLSARIMYRISSARMRQIGEVVQGKIGIPTLLITMAAALTCVTMLNKFMNIFSSVQGGVSSKIGTKPEATDDARENVWFKNDFVLSTLDLTPTSLSSNGLGRNEFSNIVSRNIIHANLHTRPGKTIPFKAFCIKGQKYVTNNHNIPLFDGVRKLDIVLCNSKDGVNTNLTIQLCESQICRNEFHDICIITIPNLPPKKDLMGYFTSELLPIKTNGFYLSRAVDGSIINNNLSCVKHCDTTIVPLDTFFGSVWGSRSAVRTVVGDCGSLLVGETAKGYVLLGIHVVGSSVSNSIAATALTSTILEEMLIEDVYTIQCGEPRISSETVTRNVGELHYKSVVRYIEQGSAEVYGSFVGFRPTHKSSVEITPNATYLSDYGYKIKNGPPIMKGYAPWRKAAIDMINPVTDINLSIVDKCVDAFTNDILSRVDSLDEVHVYDDFTALNGANGVAYVDKVNRNTSAGNPWKKSKKYFLHSIPAMHDLTDPVEVSPEITDNINFIIDDYQNGKRAMPNFCAHLKDEAVSFKKIKEGKTRVFAGAPMDWSLVVRKYTLSVIRLIQNNRFIFESAPGTVAQSYEWTEMYDYITEHGTDRIIAGDYKAFDKRMSPVFILAAFRIIKNICKASGNYTDNDLRVIDGIAQDTSFPLIDFNGDLIQFYGSNPSGHPLTVIINGLCNALYMRYAYYNLNPESEVTSFKDNVSLMTYGDDNIMSVRNTIEWYTHTTVSESFAEMGIIYTMADKEAKSIPFISMDDASFLKRSWIFDSDVGYHLAVLEHDSIEKMLMVWVKSKSISREEQCVAVISSAMREYFFYGKKIYLERQAILVDLVNHLDILDWTNESTFPTWDNLIDDFNRNSYRLKRRNA
jgi:hypothetical protein